MKTPPVREGGPSHGRVIWTNGIYFTATSGWDAVFVSYHTVYHTAFP